MSPTTGPAPTLLPSEELMRLTDVVGDCFNREDIAGVLACFADDGIYETMSGKICRGKKEIGDELQPQFGRAVGRLHFDPHALYVDVDRQTVVLQWTCEHHLDSGSTLSSKALAALGKVPVIGQGFQWDGLDVFTFRDGLVVKKQTFGKTLIPSMCLM